MKNEIKKSVQQKINKSNWDLNRFYDQKALVVLDKKYEIDTVSKVYPLQKLSYDDLRGRKKGDYSFILETEKNNLGYERADLAFVGDTIMFEDKPRVIRLIDNEGSGLVEFEDYNVFDVKLIQPREKVDFISEIGDFGINEGSQTKQQPTETKKADTPTESKQKDAATTRIPSTDPSTWGGSFSVGDEVRVRIDFNEIADVNTKFTITSIEKKAATPMKLDSRGNNVGGFKRPENPSGFLYVLNNGKNWEGKDLEIANETKKADTPSESKQKDATTTRIPSTDPSTWDGKFSVGDKVRIRIDFKEWLGKKNDTDSVFTIVSYKTYPQSKRQENPSGIIYKLSNGNGWEGKDLELANGNSTETKKADTPTQSQSPVPSEPVNRQTVEEMIKELGLVSLFIDTNYFDGKDENLDKISIGEYDLKITNKRPKPKLRLDFKVSYGEHKVDGYGLFINAKITEIEADVYKVDFNPKVNNVPEMVNKINEAYENAAKEFNKILLKSIKEELEKQKERQKEQEQKEKEKKEKGEKSEKEKGEKGEKGEQEEGEGEKGEQAEKDEQGEQGEGEQGEGEQGEGEQGEGEQGEGEQGEGEQGEGEQGEGEQGEGEQGEGEQGEGQGQGQGQGQQQEMTSEQIQNLIDQLSKDEGGESESGQSNNGNNIDLEDFLRDVNNGNIQDNDFGRNYNNQELKEQIDSRNQEEPKENEQPQQREERDEEQEKQKFFEDYVVTDVLGAIRKKLNISSEEVKRRFPTKKAITGFFEVLGKSEIDEIANNVGIPKEMSNFEKQKTISENLELELNNITNE